MNRRTISTTRRTLHVVLPPPVVGHLRPVWRLTGTHMGRGYRSRRDDRGAMLTFPAPQAKRSDPAGRLTCCNVLERHRYDDVDAFKFLTRCGAWPSAAITTCPESCKATMVSQRIGWFPNATVHGMDEEHDVVSIAQLSDRVPECGKVSLG